MLHVFLPQAGVVPHNSVLGKKKDEVVRAIKDALETSVFFNLWSYFTEKFMELSQTSPKSHKRSAYMIGAGVCFVRSYFLYALHWMQPF